MDDLPHETLQRATADELSYGVLGAEMAEIDCRSETTAGPGKAECLYAR